MNKKIILSWALSVLFLAVVASTIDIGASVSQLSKISLQLLVVSFFVYSFSFVFRAVRWKYLVKPIAHISLKDSFLIVCVSFFANNLLPARIGELLRALLLSKKSGVGKVKCLSTVVVDRLVDGITLIFVFLLVTVFSEKVPESLQKIMVLPVVVFAFGMGFFARPSFFRKIFSPFLKKFPRVYNKTSGMIDDILSGSKAFSQSPKAVVIIWLSSLMIWAVEATNLFVIARGLGIELSFVEIVLLIVIVAIGSMIPSAPAYIGTFEALFAFSFIAFGLSAESGIAMAVAAHALEFIAMLVLGLLSLNFLGISWKEITKTEKKEAKA